MVKTNLEFRELRVKVRVGERPHAEDDPLVFQADIVLEGGENHHGIGETPARAMKHAAEHWFRMSEE
jgi:hypothetical protein